MNNAFAGNYGAQQLRHYMNSDGTPEAGRDALAEDLEISISCSINADLYPDLYAALVRKSKGSRSELLRVLANEALTARRFAGLAVRPPPPDQAGDRGGDRWSTPAQGASGSSMDGASMPTPRGG